MFGPAFVKICGYFPYPIKIWLNGHEYAKRATRAAGIAVTELDNGFATTDDPAELQRIYDTLGPGVIRVFCERWWARLPLPLTEADRAAGRNSTMPASFLPTLPLTMSSLDNSVAPSTKAH